MSWCAAARTGADRPHAAALQRAHARARIWRRIVDGGGRHRLFLQFRRRPALSAGARRVRAASADAGAARARARLAVRRRRDRPRRNRWIGVREDHTVEGEPVNTIVAVALDAARRRAPGAFWPADTISSRSPRLSPDGNRLAWLAWDHPNMPWNGTMLYLADVRAMTAALGEPQLIAGGAAESIFQPEWSPDGGAIVFVSDRSGWWNLYRYELATRTTRPLAPMAAEFGLPQWLFGALDLCLRRARPDRLRLFRGGARPSWRCWT